MYNYNIDAAHSEISFKVKHLMLTTVTGYFTQFEGTLSASDESLSNGKISFSAKVDSISTNNEQRDAHLKSPDFFDAEQFPLITFKSTSFEKLSDELFNLQGDLEIKGVKKSIALKAEFGGSAKDPWGQQKIGFELSGTISRKEFGLTWGAVTEAGHVLVGDDIKLIISVQLVQQA